MRFRETMAGDVEEIAGRSSKGYDKLPGPEVCEEAITFLDEEGSPRLVMKAEKVAELYLAIDHAWSTPAMRWSMIDAASGEMMRRLIAKGYQVGYSFCADGVPNGYLRRLVAKGWNRMIERCLRYSVR